MMMSLRLSLSRKFPHAASLADFLIKLQFKGDGDSVTFLLY